MKNIETAKEAVASLNAATQNSKTRISVKCRIGVDDYDSFEHMEQFIQELKPYCKIFYLHARICILKFTTKENRAIPPLNYPRVYQLCNRFPDCQFYINGGITDLKMAKGELFISLVDDMLSLSCFFINSYMYVNYLFRIVLWNE